MESASDSFTLAQGYLKMGPLDLNNPPVIVCKWGRMRLGMLELTGLAVADSARDTGDRLTKGISR